MQIDLSIPTAGDTTPAARPVISRTGSSGEQKAPVKEETSSQKDERAVKAEIERLQSSLGKHDISLKFVRDEKTETMVVQLVNSRSGESIRQIPNEVSLKLSAELGKLQGWILDQQA